MRVRNLLLAAWLAGSATSASAQTCGPQWLPDLPGFNSSVNAATLLDPDGAGPLPTQLIMGGAFTMAGTAAANYVAAWNGTAWSQFGMGASNTVFALGTWDSNGDGVDELIAGGTVCTAEGHSIGRFAGGLCHDLSPVRPNGQVFVTTTWDPDGPGPLPRALIVGGNFSTLIDGGGNTTPMGRIALWDGAWHALSTGMNSDVKALTTWDPDGPGPLSEELVAGGNFSTAGGATVNFIAHWNGSTWQSFGGGFTGGVSSVTTWDPDGSGPLTPQVISSAHAPGGTGFGARWDGTTWQSLSPGLNISALCMVSWDPDGSGPLAPLLVAGGGFTLAGSTTVNRIASWNGTAWQAFSGGMNSGVNALATWDADGAGSAPAYLVAGGGFTVSGTHASTRWDMWTETNIPVVVTQPAPVATNCNSNAAFAVTIGAGYTNLTYRWRLNGTDLSDGATGWGSVISGATTAALQISSVSGSDAGNYDCVISNGCGGGVTSITATLTVTSSLAPDLDGDCHVDASDVALMRACMSGAAVPPAPGCANRDFDGDDDVDMVDFAILQRCYSGPDHPADPMCVN